MRKNTRIWIYTLIVIGFILILTNSCKKDDTLSKIDPVIIWSNPADISFGIFLNTIQLNAEADVAGLFVYTPPNNTKLKEGANQDLKVDFTPLDESTYNRASKRVKINVIHVAISTPVFNPNLTYGTVKDIDGNVYKTITIGTQTWMAENLRTTHYQNGEPIPEVTNSTEWTHLYTGAYCNYLNTRDKNDIATFGRLYNWFTISDKRNIAPAGWHVPSVDEWTILEGYVGGESIAGGKLRETGTTHWQSPNNEATNESGFTAVPGGERLYFDGGFGLINFDSYLWSSTESNQGYAWCLFTDTYISYASPGTDHKTYGFSVRCLKD
jgi:uncharacterized protein (TIGR02145 family)